MSPRASIPGPADAEQHRTASIAGVLYALNIVTIWGSIWLLRGIFLPRDPAGTAANVLAHQSLLRLALGLELLSTITSIGVAALLYRLFKPVDANTSVAAAFFRLTACAVAVVGYVFQFAPLELIAGHPMTGADPAGAQVLALQLYRLHNLASNAVILLFGFHFILLGGLIFRSGFLPRLLGILVGLAGLGALSILSPSLSPLLPYFLGPALLAELSLTVCLLALGRGLLSLRQAAGVTPS